ncbi:MAG: hypothetical protein Q7R33_01095 [Nitrosarchaeum sp.]|nr:hypothetical protein [Nitrosarchaeum sp.]
MKYKTINEVTGILEAIVYQKDQYKIGLDVHGVITKYPEVFGPLSKELLTTGHEIHIVTGAKISRTLVEKLLDYNVFWTSIFSIVNFHEATGIQIKYDDKGPWIENNLWNQTKAMYAKNAGLDWHIDDSEIYGQYFDEHTNYLLLK